MTVDSAPATTGIAIETDKEKRIVNAKEKEANNEIVILKIPRKSRNCSQLKYQCLYLHKCLCRLFLDKEKKDNDHALH
jgi:hypothetical protein